MIPKCLCMLILALLTIYEVWLYILVECTMCDVWIVNMCYSYEMIRLLIWNILLKINIRQWVSLVKYVEWTEHNGEITQTFAFIFFSFFIASRFPSYADRKKEIHFPAFQRNDSFEACVVFYYFSHRLLCFVVLVFFFCHRKVARPFHFI